MADLPFWFTNDDKSNPVYCRACKQHIPKQVFMAGKGLCPNCLRRVSATAGHAERTTITPAGAATGPLLAHAESALPKSKDRPVSAGLDATKIAILILVVGFVIALVRVTLKI